MRSTEGPTVDRLIAPTVGSCGDFEYSIFSDFYTRDVELIVKLVATWVCVFDSVILSRFLAASRLSDVAIDWFEWNEDDKSVSFLKAGCKLCHKYKMFSKLMGKFMSFYIRSCCIYNIMTEYVIT